MDRQIFVLLLGAILASPLGWVYYLPLAYAPILGWMGAGAGWDGLSGLGRTRAAMLAVGLALLCVPQEVANSSQPAALASLTLASAYHYGTLLAWLTPTTRRG